MKHKLKIADFTKYPGGRYKKYGPGSGEEYRKEHLLPALNKHDLVELDLSGVYAFSPSFVSEITDQVIRAGLLSHEEYCRRISFVSDKENKHYIKKMFEAYRDECDPKFIAHQEATQDERDQELLNSLLEDV